MSVAEAVNIANEFQISLEYLLGRYPYPLPVPQNDEEWMLYEKLGQMDENEAIDVIVAESVPESGLGRAIMDRLRRASAVRE